MEPRAKTAAIARAGALLSIAVGGLGLLGWLLGLGVLRSVVPGWVSIRPVTALALVLLGASLWPEQQGTAAPRPGIRHAMALIAGLAGLLSLVEYVFGIDLGIDRLLLHESPGYPQPLFPGRMAPTTAVNLLLLSTARLAMDARGWVARRMVEPLTVLAGAIAALVLIGYWFDVAPVESGSHIVRMAVNTALAFLAVCAGILACYRDSALVRALTSDPPGGIIARRVLPVMLLAILMLEWVGLGAERQGFYNPYFGSAVQALANMVLLGILLLWFAAEMNRTEAERLGVQKALQRSDAEYRGLVEHAPLGVYRSTPEGRFLHVNPALVTMLGYESVEEVLRLDLARDVYADPRARAALIPQYAQQDVANAETVWKRKDGRPLTVRLSVRILRGPAGRIECFEGLAEDITQQRSLEDQVRQAQRLEAVGRLAGGVSHDFNNILTAITGFSDLLLEDLAPGDPKRADVEEIRAAATRAAALTRQLLAFSRKQVLQPRVMDVNGLVTGLHRVLQRLIGEDVRLEVALAPGLGAVRADPGQLEQVILNLAVNARDAMPHGGRLTIETENVELDEAYARDHPPTAPGPYVLLAVSDTGVGMDAEVRSHLFEPFYTTKEQGKGTGLGLATVYGIVQQSGGHVWAYSEPGRGATFKIYLPRVNAPVEASAPVPTAVPAAGGRETVLLAEDDPGVREVASDALEHKGYHLLRAPDGQTALEMAAAHAGTIHLLVTDMVMPGMTGRELAEALAALRPGIRVLYMSGYTDDAVIRHGVLEDSLPYLQKPFAPDALARKVREVLDRP
jgi:two-component system cell cycle sensor histidine kinase/response regulator CckA